VTRKAATNRHPRAGERRGRIILPMARDRRPPTAAGSRRGAPASLAAPSASMPEIGRGVNRAGHRARNSSGGRRVGAAIRARYRSVQSCREMETSRP